MLERSTPANRGVPFSRFDATSGGSFFGRTARAVRRGSNPAKDLRRLAVTETCIPHAYGRRTHARTPGNSPESTPKQARLVRPPVRPGPPAVGGRPTGRQDVDPPSPLGGTRTRRRGGPIDLTCGPFATPWRAPQGPPAPSGGPTPGLTAERREFEIVMKLVNPNLPDAST